jgi:hypothetical protein
MLKTIVAIHQPTFLPWLGFFDKIVRADIFVVLDNVYIQKTGGSWCNRVKMMVSDQARWVSAPIDRTYHGKSEIKDVKFNDTINWRDKILKTIELNYKRHEFFTEVFADTRSLVSNPCNQLSKYNVDAARSLCKSLKIDDDKIVLASSLDGPSGKGTSLLISIVKTVGGSAYLCGGGAGGYQEDCLFEESGVDLVYQKFSHPPYPQKGADKFVPGLSIVDVLMNCGFKETIRLIHGENFLEQSEPQ